MPFIEPSWEMSESTTAEAFDNTLCVGFGSALQLREKG
jgi:hypothetical protein